MHYICSLMLLYATICYFFSDARFCTTIMCLDNGIGPKRSTATFSQHFSGTLCSPNGSLIFLSVNALHASNFLLKVLTCLSTL